MKNKIVYESNIHTGIKSHDVLVIQDTKVNGVKLKMTYECYNAVERFTGDLFVSGKWEHFFSLGDLGITSDSSNYVKSETFRQNRCKQLRELGIKFFNLMMS